MMAGTSKERRFIPIHEIHSKLSSEVLASLMAFHAISGCDTTSYIRGQTNRSMWKTYTDNSQLLQGLGKGPLTEEIVQAVEKFFCNVYKVNADSVDDARRLLFAKATQPECLPPTSDALQQHAKRSHIALSSDSVGTGVLQRV